jgi:hypothetical protein
MGFRGASRTQTRRTRTGIGFRPTLGCFDTSGWSSCGPRCMAEAVLRPSVRFRAPTKTKSLQPRTAASSIGPKTDERLVPRCCLSWGFVPYDTVSDQRIRMSGGGSLHRRVPRSRFGYLLRGLHHRSYRRAKRRSIPGLRPSRRSPRRERYPSRGPCPPDVAGDTTPRRERRRTGRLQGLVPASESVLPPSSRRNPAVDAFLGLSPPERSLHPPGRSLVVTMPALSSLGRVTSLPAWTSGLRGSDGSALSVSGLPALLGFRTFRPSRRSVQRPRERAHGFTSRRTSRKRDTYCDLNSLQGRSSQGS